MSKTAKTAGTILCGGQSARMGEPKGLVALEDRPMIAHVIDWITPHVESLALSVGPHSDLYGRFGIACLIDRFDGQQGPASGLLAALEWAETRGADRLLTAPCDMPYLPADLPGLFEAAIEDAPVYARSPLGAHYAVALWPVSARPTVNALMSEADERALRKILAACGAQALDCDDADAFRDLNAPSDL